MARRRRRKKYWANLGKPELPSLPQIELDPETKKGIIIVFIVAVGAISLLSLFGLAGAMGDFIFNILQYIFGWGKFLFPLILIAIGYFSYNGEKYEVRGANYLGVFLFIISFHTLLHAFIGQDMWQAGVSLGTGGGYIGMFFLTTFAKLMGFWASLIVILGLLVVSLMLMLNTTLMGLFGRESWFGKLMSPVYYIFNRLFRKREEEDEDEDPSASSGQEEEDDEEEEEENEEEEEEEENEDDEKEEESDDEEEDDGEDGEDEDPSTSSGQEKKEIAPVFMAKKVGQVKLEDSVWWKPTGVEIDLPFELLSAKKGKPTSGDIKANLEIIEHTLAKFGIPVEMGEVSVGPTVTQYTFKPAEGVRLSKITTLSNDLALALAAHPIRIEAPIPGKSLVGIEVPNQTKALVGLREILSDKDFTSRKSDLTIALGKDVAGKAWLYDIARMPHLLVAGATNSGKSVCLNTIILSLLYANNPDDIKFIMVDPKRVELPVYNGTSYLLTPVITDVQKTINALKWCLNEMDRRYDILSIKGKRNIQTYNESAKLKMPYIVFVIDELADLMVVAAKEIEGSIIRLAQMARAVGIHLILATQRPSVDVITGLIKANMPARIAFSVASGIDSRTILDSLGAEKLLGRGDMLFSTAELSKPKRIQGAFVSDLEIKKVIRFIKENGAVPNYIDGVTEKQKVNGIGGMGMNGDAGSADGDDELLGEAKELIINGGKASASLLQRRLSIGYARAARILDLLEQMGVVGPANGAKPREIMITKEQYEAMEETGVAGVSLHNRDEAEAPEEFLPEEDDEEDEGSLRSEDRRQGRLGGSRSSKEDSSAGSGQEDDEEDETEDESDEEDNNEEEETEEEETEEEETEEEETEEEETEEEDETVEENDPSTSSGQGDERDEDNNEEDEEGEESDDEDVSEEKTEKKKTKKKGGTDGVKDKNVKRLLDDDFEKYLFK